MQSRRRTSTTPKTPTRPYLIQPLLDTNTMHSDAHASMQHMWVLTTNTAAAALHARTAMHAQPADCAVTTRQYSKNPRPLSS
jgi:hypothetical protein